MKGNKGEWSELYTLLKLMAEGRIYAADENTNKIESIYYEVLKAIRNQTDGSWEYIRNGSIRIVSGETGEEIISIPIEKFKEQSDILYHKIIEQKSSKGAFEIPEVWDFAKGIKCNTLKAKSIDKSDILLVVHDIKTFSEPTLGFSIKSRLGSPSTLFNASKATNFTYKVVGHHFTDKEKEEYEQIKGFKEKFDYMYERNADIVFSNIDNASFEFNLKMLDTSLPLILAKVVEKFFKGEAISIKDLTEKIAEVNPLGISNGDSLVFYSFKIKELLTNIALGMVAATRWDGKYDATGGYIIVKEDGDVLCYHIYNRNEFREYLYLNTKLESPGKSKHGYGVIEERADGQILKLNLQIRFIK